MTTNPTILARDIEEGMTLSNLLKELRRLTEGKKLFVQVTSDDAAEMLDLLSAHPGTDKELASFRKNWGAKFGKGISELI